MTSNWFNDGTVSVGSVLLDAETIQRRVRELGAQVTKDYWGKYPHLVCILKGASIFHADLIRSIDLALSIDFVAVGSYGAATQTSGEVRILKDLDESIEKRDILLVEDILDTGLTLHHLLHHLESRRPNSLKVITLLDKPSRRRIPVPVHYVGFEIPDHFAVGYGLDFNQRYRNLPDIRILNSATPSS